MHVMIHLVSVFAQMTMLEIIAGARDHVLTLVGALLFHAVWQAVWLVWTVDDNTSTMYCAFESLESTR